MASKALKKAIVSPKEFEDLRHQYAQLHGEYTQLLRQRDEAITQYRKLLDMAVELLVTMDARIIDTHDVIGEDLSARKEIVGAHDTVILATTTPRFLDYLINGIALDNQVRLKANRLVEKIKASKEKEG